MIKRLLILGIFIFTFIACKKDKLEGDKAILIGKWEWIITTEEKSNCSEDPFIYDTTYAHLSDFTYTLEFLEKGKIKVYKNTTLIMNKRIVFDIFKENGGFNINLDGDGLQDFSGNVNNDSLYIVDYPLKGTSCDYYYYNYFVRQ